MTENHQMPPVVEGLKPTGRDVAALALAAADEIDDLSLGKAIHASATLQLAKRLRGSFVHSENPLVGAQFIDSEDVAVFCHALGDAGLSPHLGRLDDLVSQARDISDSLDRVMSDPEKSNLIRIRDFCLALANASSSFRLSVYELRPPHPFRS